jgi:hypothetical protein
MNETHRVRRWRWSARAPDTATALALRRALRAQHEACEDALERAGTAVVPAGEVWHVPRLELSVRLGAPADVETARFVEQVETALREALAQLATTPRPATTVAGVAAAPATLRGGDAPVRRTNEADGREALRHYLSTGMLAWTLAGLAGETAHELLAAAAVATAGAVRRGELPLGDLLPAGSDDVRIGALLRWLALLPAPVRRAWVASHGPDPRDPALPAPVVAAWRRAVDSEAADRIEWQALWLAQPLAAATLRRRLAAAGAARRDAAPFTTAPAAAIEARAVAIAPPAQARPHAAAIAAIDEDARLPRPAARAAADAAPTALLVPLAGLVLLHPWLARLLGACGVLDADGKAIDPAQRARAHALLHALACGETEPAEHELPFVKLLLGGRPDEPLDVRLPHPGAADRTEVDALLAAVREHWRALRGTGVEGLRLSFLQRRGLLSHDDGGWRLQVQSEPFDLLLATLPWSLGLVRLPWMREPLTVEWQAS